uniref:PolyA_pol_RNAbd domain-containing protein n=1 Tax=Macrostomum lignano TaxID=282301 RepID=A0A1I8FAU7_9PLAT
MSNEQSSLVGAVSLQSCAAISKRHLWRRLTSYTALLHRNAWQRASRPVRMDAGRASEVKKLERLETALAAQDLEADLDMLHDNRVSRNILKALTAKSTSKRLKPARVATLTALSKSSPHYASTESRERSATPSLSSLAIGSGRFTSRSHHQRDVFKNLEGQLSTTTLTAATTWQPDAVADEADKETLAAVAQNAAGLGGIAGERIWVELKQILAGRRPDDLIGAMASCGVEPNVQELSVVLNASAADTDKCRSIDQCRLCFWRHLLRSNDELETAHARLKFSNEEIGRVEDLAALTSAKTPRTKQRVVQLLLYTGQAATILPTISQWWPPKFPVNGHSNFIQLEIVNRWQRPDSRPDH